MCGRYTNTGRDTQLLAQRFGVEAGSIPLETLGRYNVCPTESVLIVADDGAARTATGARFGLTPWWTANGRPLLNARAETAAAKAIFARLMERPDRRCLVVADGWYEWLRPEAKGAPRTPFHYRVDSGAPFAFAGLWDPGRRDDGPSVCILTTSANAVCRPVHDRMPCVLAGFEEEGAWLSGSVDLAAAVDLLTPLPDARVSAAPANPAVNKAGVEGAELLAPPPATEPPPTLPGL